MEEQNDLEYYIIEETLFAYGNYYDFFRTYNKKTGQWETSKLSPSQFFHDFWYKKITENEAKEITGNNLPIDAYEKYCESLSNLKIK